MILREEPGHAGNIYLTTTEREFMAASDYNKFIDRSGSLRLGGTLHYLDPTGELLATFRSLRVVHSPQLYGGRKHVHPMSEVLVHPKTGEFVHPGEFESWQRVRKRWERIGSLPFRRLHVLPVVSKCWWSHLALPMDEDSSHWHLRIYRRHGSGS